MKKLLSTILLISAVLATVFAAPKKGKSKNIKLDPKKKFAIEGVELGSLEWTQKYASLNNKGEIIWKYDTGEDWLHYGWDLRGTDMSQYAGLKIEFTSKEKQDIRFVVRNPAAVGDWTFPTQVGNVMYVMFNGVGKWYGDMENPDPTKGYEMYFLVEAKNKYSKTAIKSIELLSKIDYPDADELKILGVPFGSQIWKARITGNEITWLKGDTGGDAGWNFGGIDLSEYDRVRIEIESNTAAHLGLRICDSEHNNWHGYDMQIEPNVYEVDLSGEGASWLGDNAGPLDKSKGLQIFLQTWDRKKEEKTVVKSIQLLKGKRVINENLMIEGVAFGTCGWASNVYDGGVIDWGDGKEKYPCTGWNVKGIDFSEYTKIRIVVEEGTSALPLTLSLYQEQNDCGKQFNAVSPTVLEANIDGSECDFEGGNKESWDSSKKIDQIKDDLKELAKDLKERLFNKEISPKRFVALFSYMSRNIVKRYGKDLDIDWLDFRKTIYELSDGILEVYKYNEKSEEIINEYTENIEEDELYKAELEYYIEDNQFAIPDYELKQRIREYDRQDAKIRKEEYQKEIEQKYQTRKNELLQRAEERKRRQKLRDIM